MIVKFHIKNQFYVFYIYIFNKIIKKLTVNITSAVSFLELQLFYLIFNIHLSVGLGVS